MSGLWTPICLAQFARNSLKYVKWRQNQSIIILGKPLTESLSGNFRGQIHLTTFLCLPIPVILNADMNFSWNIFFWGPLLYISIEVINIGKFQSDKLNYCLVESNCEQVLKKVMRKICRYGASLKNMTLDHALFSLQYNHKPEYRDI